MTPGKEMRQFMHNALADVNRRQDREIDMINTSINRVDHGVAELRKEVEDMKRQISMGDL